MRQNKKNARQPPKKAGGSLPAVAALQQRGNTRGRKARFRGPLLALLPALLRLASSQKSGVVSLFAVWYTGANSLRQQLEQRHLSMDEEEKKIRERMEREAQITARSVKRRLRLAAKLSTKSRKATERRKYLAGSWALDREQRDPQFAAMMRDGLNRIWLVRDDDRALWDLPPLPEEEKNRRFGFLRGSPRRTQAQKIRQPAGAGNRGCKGLIAAPRRFAAHPPR